MKPSLLIKPNPTDYISGVDFPFKGVTNGDWTPHIQFFESQRNPLFETDGCELFTGQESFDAQMDVLLPSFNQEQQAWLLANGYMDIGNDGKSHFHSSPRFLEVTTGNGTKGNSMPEVWNVIRQYGVLPWTDLPFTETMAEAEYFAPIPQALKDKAAQFLALVGGKQAIQYQWIINGGQKNLELMSKAIIQAPLCLGIAVTDEWNQPVPSDPPLNQQPQHAVMCYKIDGSNTLIFDHYVPYNKTLDAGYPIPYVFQGILTPVFQVVAQVATIAQEAITVAPQLPQLQEFSLLSAVSNLISSFLMWLQK